MDSFLFEYSLDDSKPENIALTKEVLYAYDENSGVYNGQIRFNTSGLSNSGKWLAWKEATIMLPFVVSFRSSAATDLTATAGAAAGAFIAGLKNGYYNIIDSIQVDYNNTNVVQQTNNINQFCNFKLLTTMSDSDVRKWGSTIGFSPDTPAYIRAVAANAAGLGMTNNRNVINPPAASFGEPFPANAGFLNRQRETTAYSSRAGALSGTVGFTNVVQVGKNYYSAEPVAAGANAVYYHVILCSIRLADLCDFFDKMPLVKGGFFKIDIVYNSCSHTIGCTNAPALTMAASATTVRSGRTCPYLVSSSAADNAANLAVVANNGNNLLITCDVVKTSQVSPTLPFNNCRIYVPAYELDPIKESQLLQIKPIRKVNYNDVYMFQYYNIGTGGDIQRLITNGLKDMKYIVVIPSYNHAAIGADITASIPTPALSPFDSYPATGHPFCSLTNFNIQIGGRNIFQEQFRYDFEFFTNEIASINAINGAAEMGLTSGLIDRSRWDNGYRFYVADLSRRASLEDGVAKSVQLLGTNNTPYSIDITVFIVYGKSVSIDMAEGRLVA